jgi:uroporphyrinogen decarboxylase
MAYQAVDHFPYRPQGFWNATIQRWRTEGLPEDARPHDYFGFEKWIYLPLDLTLRPKFEREVLREDNETEVVRSEKGIVQKEFKKNAELSMPEWIEFPVKSRRDWQEMSRRYPTSLDGRVPGNWAELVAGWKTREEVLGLDLYNGFYMTLREWLGPEDLLYAFIDEPAWIEEMLEFYADFLIQTIEPVLREVEVDFVSFSEDMAYKGGPFVSPEMFRRFFAPQYARVSELFRKYGIDWFVIDSDGNPEPLIPALLESGVRGIHPCECAAGMDVVELRRKYGRDLRLWCGIDKRVLTQDRAAIKAELERKVPPMLDDGGYIPQIDHSVPPNVPFENFCYYWEELKRLGNC